MRAFLVGLLLSGWLSACGRAPVEAAHPPDAGGPCAPCAACSPCDDAGVWPDDGGLVDSGTPGEPEDAGLGARLTATGAVFRLWAPHSDAVTLVGDFTGWDAGVAMAESTDGVWSATVDGAQAGQRYRFEVGYGGKVYGRSDPRALALDDAAGPSVLVDTRAYHWLVNDFTPPPYAEQVIYELHVGTFNVPPGAPHGSYRSAIDRLDFVAALGVNMIELLPISEFGGARSWGYNPAGLFAVESSYGTPDDFKALVDAAHARGIGVIVDVVHNHYDDGPLLRCFDGDCLGARGIYFYADARGTTPWGPRPDFGRAQVRDFVADNAALWLSEYRCDGLRWDSTVNIRTANGADVPDGWHLLQRANALSHAVRPGAIAIAEDWQGDDWLSRPVGQGGAGFDAQWDGFVHEVNGTILAASDAARSMATIRTALTRAYNGHAFERVVFTESHDEVANGNQRIPSMIDGAHPDSLAARKRSTLGAAVALTAPGVPMLFMGQELLTDKWFADDRPLDWTRAATYAGIVQLYTDLVHLRRNTSGVTEGLTGEGTSVFHVNDGAKVIAWRRWRSAGDDVVVVANFSGKSFPTYDIGFPAGGTWHLRFDSDDPRYSPDFTGAGADVTPSQVAYDGLAFRGRLALGAYSLQVYSR